MAIQRFEMKQGTSAKFWQIKVEGASHTVAFGRIGTTGQTKTKDFHSQEAAKVSAEKLIGEKLKKGYKQVGSKKAASKAKSTAMPAKTAKRKTAVPKSSNDFWNPLSKREQEARPAITPKLVKARENALGIRFPKSLIKLLQKQNGGYLKDPEFIVGGKTYYLEEIPPICEEWGFESMADGYPDHVEAVKNDLPGPQLIFPLCGDGHWFIALDYRASGSEKQPEVIYLDIEGVVRVETIAKTFDEILAGHQTGKQKLAVRFDEIDPKTIIGEADLQTGHKMGDNAIKYQAKLCLTDTQVILYAHETWTKPPCETWEKYVAELKVLEEEWLRIETGHGYFTTPTSTLYVHVDTNVQPIVGMECERTKTNGWKNLPCKGRNHFAFISSDEALLDKCRVKILRALKNLKR